MSNLSNMPWEDRPAGSKEVVWRYSANPIIPRDLLPTSNSIFNSAVVPFGDSYAGVFRCDDTNRRMRLHVGFSKDAVHWDINPEPLKFECDNAEVGGMGVRLRPTCLFYRRPLLCHLVQRLQRSAYYRCGVDKGLQDVPSVGECFPAIQSQRSDVSAQDKRPLCHVEPPER